MALSLSPFLTALVKLVKWITIVESETGLGTHSQATIYNRKVIRASYNFLFPLPIVLIKIYIQNIRINFVGGNVIGAVHSLLEAS